MYLDPSWYERRLQEVIAENYDQICNVQTYALEAMRDKRKQLMDSSFLKEKFTRKSETKKLCQPYAGEKFMTKRGDYYEVVPAVCR
jgi:hypothetical protein